MAPRLDREVGSMRASVNRPALRKQFHARLPEPQPPCTQSEGSSVRLTAFPRVGESIRGIRLSHPCPGYGKTRSVVRRCTSNDVHREASRQCLRAALASREETCTRRPCGALTHTLDLAVPRRSAVARAQSAATPPPRSLPVAMRTAGTLPCSRWIIQPAIDVLDVAALPQPSPDGESAVRSKLTGGLAERTYGGGPAGAEIRDPDHRARSRHRRRADRGPAAWAGQD